MSRFDCARRADDERYQRNTYVQVRRSSDAADALALYAFEQTRVAAFGAGLALVTMLAAIGAAIFAGLAAFHTRRSADVAVASERAYLFVFPDVAAGNPSHQAQTTLYNAGKTPALVTRLLTHIHSMPEVIDRMLKDDGYYNGRNIVVPGGERLSLGYAPFQFGDEQTLRFRCVAEYQDVFGTKGVARFAYRIVRVDNAPMLTIDHDVDWNAVVPHLS